MYCAVPSYWYLCYYPTRYPQRYCPTDEDHECYHKVFKGLRENALQSIYEGRSGGIKFILKPMIIDQHPASGGLYSIVGTGSADAWEVIGTRKFQNYLPGDCSYQKNKMLLDAFKESL